MIHNKLLKKATASAALHRILPHLKGDMVIGIGTGSTVNFFIDALAEQKSKFDGCVASSEASTDRLKKHKIPVYDLNYIHELHFYIDGADESNNQLQLIKGGGAALAREKIIAAVAREFICIADENKLVDVLGHFPLPVEVIPMARSYVARKLVKLGGNPIYRGGIVTDNGNIILDVWNLQITDAISLEGKINQITGVVTHGLFAARPANVILLGTKNNGVNIIERS